MTSPLILTGASGFLGWHVRVLARAHGLPDPIAVTRADLCRPDLLAGLLSGADRVLHVAGVNRGEADLGNRELADQLAAGLRRCATPPKTVVFANSIQAGNGTAYGDGKAAAAATLAEATEWSGSRFEDVRLPNLFGEHGRPYYNSVVATFCRELADGNTPRVDQDRPLDLLHATDAAALLAGLPAAGPTRCGVGDLLDRLREMAARYAVGEIPSLTSRFDVRLFNTYRSHLFPATTPFPLPCHSDTRGDLVEAVKVHGGGGQTFVSTTNPGITRGEHFHLAKVERFLVLRGEALIRVRRVLHDDIHTFRVRGERPAFVDMPAMWAHSITNIGDSDLLTLFWSNEVFDPGQPDTFPERVVA
ncbi:polysaccharide biosynthesis C-terminal domain-containing protein [Winogradskya humida]|uniref:Capsular polysaccharide biosynthesis protein CapF n=1 Tax=Winogradskya humida TaxID=113566 RepID=A0ABQ3ZZA6_9ACTN|nr:NAD-dependent epimerase/dehydratase family protein [Actinoplanes humidus]GIE23437.1 capsular polysaccharide biosynthesis protein CapF [Actinoplanes humidus]